MTKRVYIIGSNEIKTSKKGENIINPIHDWNYSPRVKQLSFMNYEDCTVKINDSTSLFLKAYQGVNLSVEGQYIDKFVIETSGINYQFLGVC